MTLGISSANVAVPFLNVLRGTAWTPPTGLFVKLHAGDPGPAGLLLPAAGSTTRVVVTLAAPAGNAIAITGTIPAWTNGGTSESLTDISVWDSLTGGLFLWSAILTAPQSWAAANTFSLTAISVAISPIAA